ncbi:MAG: carbohydrate ABC transporter permease [Spirochaetes bacterium]|nr:carbohydrate ABC transporter permease [Spirochaetota bacterium]
MEKKDKKIQLYRVKKTILDVLKYLFLSVGSLIMVFPFVWMVITSLKAPDETTKFPPTLIPEVKYFIQMDREDDLQRVRILKELPEDKVKVEIILGLQKQKQLVIDKSRIIKKRLIWENYSKAWKSAPFGRYFINNFIMAGGTTILYILTSLLAGYAFSKMHFPLKKTIFGVLLATIMVPGQLLLIPNYVILARLGWINTFYALIIPFSVNIMGIYFLTQYIDTIPQDLFDAAMIDGCSNFQILKKIVAPLSKSVLLTIGLIGFVGHWNALLWPLIVTNSPEMRTLQVGLAVFRQESGIYWELLTAAATFSLIPLIILFLLVQKHYITGIARTGLK